MGRTFRGLAPLQKERLQLHFNLRWIEFIFTSTEPSKKETYHVKRTILKHCLTWNYNHDGAISLNEHLAKNKLGDTHKLVCAIIFSTRSEVVSSLSPSLKSHWTSRSDSLRSKATTTLGSVFSRPFEQKRVMFDIFFCKKQRECMPNLKLNKRCAALTNDKNGVRFIFH